MVQKKASNLNIPLVIGIISWCILVTTVILFIVSIKFLIIGQKVFNTTIVIFIILTLISGVTSFIGMSWGLVNYYAKRQKKKVVIISIIINIFYIVIDIVFTVILVKLVFDAMMGV